MQKFKTKSAKNIKEGGNSADILNLKFDEFDLGNGLHCILHHDDRNPVVNVTIGYKVGSKNEKRNKRGIAHLFEHIMFQGSENVKKNDFFQHILNAGGIMNAFTTFDATVYFETLPSNHLDLALWLESDRMNSLQVTEENLENQKSVVIEEKLQRYENTPYGTAIANLFRNLFEGSNYEWPVIGEVEDISSFTLEEAKEFHNNYYSPQNAVLIISGDFNPAEVKESISKYFGGIKKKFNSNGVISSVGKLKEDRELTVYDNISLPAIYIGYQITPVGSKADYALEYFSDIIANKKSSRLYKKFVYEEKVLRSIQVTKYPLESTGIYILRAMLNPGVEIEEMKARILKEIEDAINEGISDSEFESLKNQIEFKNLLQFQTVQNISVETVFNWIYFQDAGRINNEILKFHEVKKDDVISCAKEFLLNNSKVILKYLPKNE